MDHAREAASHTGPAEPRPQTFISKLGRLFRS
jgi:hypothetical protein